MEKQVNDFVKKYGIEKSVAQEICSSHSSIELEVILDFLNNYGQMIKVK